ncbi:MAG: phage protein Gp27 family protein [Pseudomonadota bacterium]
MEVQLPPEVRTELEQKLVKNGFADYASLHEWLQGKGYAFSITTVKRFGKRFEERCEMVRLATQQADMMRQHFGDDEQAMSEASLQMAQSLMFNLMLERGESLTPKEISMITRALSDTTRASVAVKNYQDAFRAKVEAKMRELEQVGNQGLSTSIDAHTLKRVREEIYGLF